MIFILFAMTHFQPRNKIAPLAEPAKLKFEPARVLEAVGRGSRMNADLTDGAWDVWVDRKLPLTGVRAKYGVVPDQPSFDRTYVDQSRLLGVTRRGEHGRHASR